MTLEKGLWFPKGAPDGGRPTAEEAEAAVRTLIRWAGDDPDREGLIDTPGAGGAQLSRALRRL